jgi:2-octaprenyl-6-methoxyphenol hydroxylase
MTTSLSKISIAIVGAGPVGTSLAIWLAQMLPRTRITLLDARPLNADLHRDPRTLALSWGSVQMLKRHMNWPANAAEPILEVQISQQSGPRLPFGSLEQERFVQITARQQKTPMLGAVMRYGALLQPLQALWLQAQAAQPHRLQSRFGTKVVAITSAGLASPPVAASASSGPPRWLVNLGSGLGTDSNVGVEVQFLASETAPAADGDQASCQTDSFDLVVMAEGSSMQQNDADEHLAHTRTYKQTAWLGTVEMAGAPRGVAFERFTLNGPAALLPLDDQQNALVWCVPRNADPVRAQDDAARMAMLNSIFPKQAGEIKGISALKPLPLVMRTPCRQLADPRIWRIGNAAQTLHPVAGQGLNLGLRDAWICAQTLRQTLAEVPANQNPSWRKAAKSFENARAPDRWTMLLTTDALARGFTLDWPGLMSARELGLTALQTFSPLKSTLANHLMFGWR